VRVLVLSRFTLPIAPTAADIDELGHVSNLVYLRWVLDIATAHSASLGWSHPEYRALGSVFVVRRHEIDYVAQVLEGEQLVGETWVESWKLASCIRKTELKRGEQIVARASTTWAMLSFGSGRPTKIPDHLRELFT
jgi:acyl-CoA thioester hydrolase